MMVMMVRVAMVMMINDGFSKRHPSSTSRAIIVIISHCDQFIIFTIDFINAITSKAVINIANIATAIATIVITNASLPP